MIESKAKLEACKECYFKWCEAWAVYRQGMQMSDEMKYVIVKEMWSGKWEINQLSWNGVGLKFL